VLARVFEEHGLATTSISLVREHTEKVKPPRALFVPFPFGHPLGEANDPELQTRVMGAAFALLERETGPVLEDYPEDVYAGQNINLAQANSVPRPDVSDDVAFEVTRLRPYYEQWVSANAGRTAVGVTGVEQRRFRGLVRLLEAYAEGREIEQRRAIAPVRALGSGRPQGVLPGGTPAAKAGRFVPGIERVVVERDPKLDAIAFGIAR